MVKQSFPPALLDANRPHLVEAAASVRNLEPILVTKEDATAPLLSPQEKVIRAASSKVTNKCIARKIDVTEAIVKVRSRQSSQDPSSNRTQAAVWGINNGSHTRRKWRMTFLRYWQPIC
jgi:DNA-binding NarL/FixJ family response regulator